MKRLLIVILVILLTSCTNNNDQKDAYNRFIMEANAYDSSEISENLPFDITLNIEKVIDSEITYRVILDNPKEPIKDIKVIVIHNYETNDIYPTSGIFENTLSLIPNEIDLDKDNVKGIILVGYINFDKDVELFDGSFKVLVEYNDEQGQTIKKYREYHK